MQRWIWTGALAAVMATAFCGFAGEVPLSIAGFTIGRPIAEVPDRVIMETALPVRYMENLQEVEILPTPGFKSGLIAFGTCRQPHSIVRLKLKTRMAASSSSTSSCGGSKRIFGDPHEYQGDPFRVFISWKWSLTDALGNRVSLTLQHNLQDEEEKIGNAVKLTLHNRLEEDVRCYKQQKTHRRDIVRQWPPPAASSSASGLGRHRSGRQLQHRHGLDGAPGCLSGAPGLP